MALSFSNSSWFVYVKTVDVLKCIKMVKYWSSTGFLFIFNKKKIKNKKKRVN